MDGTANEVLGPNGYTFRDEELADPHYVLLLNLIRESSALAAPNTNRWQLVGTLPTLRLRIARLEAAPLVVSSISFAAPVPVGRMAPLPLHRSDGMSLAVLRVPPLQESGQVSPNRMLLTRPLAILLTEFNVPNANSSIGRLVGTLIEFRNALYEFS